MLDMMSMIRERILVQWDAEQLTGMTSMDLSN